MLVLHCARGVASSLLFGHQSEAVDVAALFRSRLQQYAAVCFASWAHSRRRCVEQGDLQKTCAAREKPKACCLSSCYIAAGRSIDPYMNLQLPPWRIEKA